MSACLSQFVGFFFWNAGLAMGGISRVGQTMLLQPFVIVLMAAAINGEPLEFSTLLFATAVIASVLHRPANARGALDPRPSLF